MMSTAINLLSNKDTTIYKDDMDKPSTQDIFPVTFAM
jgi:hypothetical protein